MQNTADSQNTKQLGDSRYVIESVTKSLQVLFAFKKSPHRFSVTEVESITGLPKNQVFRSLKSLEEFGLLRMDSSGCYRVTPLIYQVAEVAEMEAPIEEVAHPVMDQLKMLTGETINLCYLVEGQSVIVARKHSHHGVLLTSKLGQRSPLHSGANPKAMLAFLGKEEQEKVVSMLPFLPRYTPKTQLEPHLLMMELHEIKQRGYSISDEDFELGARGVGAPIFDRRGQVVGGISAGGPTTRIGLEDLENFAPHVIVAAQKISRLLGFHSHS